MIFKVKTQANFSSIELLSWRASQGTAVKTLDPNSMSMMVSLRLERAGPV